MKILVLTHGQYVTKGLPKVIEMTESVAALGHAVTLVATSRTRRFRSERFARDGVRTVLAPSVLWGRLRQGADPIDLLWRLAMLRRERFDVVHAVDSRPTVILAALAVVRRSRCPLVIEWSDLFGRGGTIAERSGRLYAATLGHVETFFEERFRHRADAAIATTSLLVRRLVAMGYPEERIHLQRYGCDTRRYRPQPPAEARQRLGLSPDATILCYAGTLYPADARLLLDALALVSPPDGARLQTVLVGEHRIDSRLAARLGVLLPGRVPDFATVHDYLSAADLCLVPMRVSLANQGRWPSKVSDYFNAGRPVVATKVSDFEALYREHDLGFLADQDTPQGLADALQQAFAQRHRWEEIGQACRRFAEAELDLTRLAAERVSAYVSAAEHYETARRAGRSRAAPHST